MAEYLTRQGIDMVEGFISSPGYAKIYDSLFPRITAKQLLVDLDIQTQRCFQSVIVEICYISMSVGLSLGIVLQNGNRIFCRISPKERSSDQFKLKYQQLLGDAGVGCPKILAGTIRFGDCLIVFQEYVQDGDFVDASMSPYREKLAHQLVLVNRLFDEFRQAG